MFMALGFSVFNLSRELPPPELLVPRPFVAFRPDTTRGQKLGPSLRVSVLGFRV